MKPFYNELGGAVKSPNRDNRFFFVKPCYNEVLLYCLLRNLRILLRGKTRNTEGNGKY